MHPRFIGTLFVGVLAWSQLASSQGVALQGVASQTAASQPAAAGQVRIPSRSQAPLFEGEQGRQGSEIHSDRATGLVTIKLQVQDPSGYFIPNIRRENFAVYENGIRQNNVMVEIEHAAVSLGLLMEHGGRYLTLSRAVSEEVARAGQALLEVLGRDDKIAIWAYGDSEQQLSDFSKGQESLDELFYGLKAPEVSETNLYDALMNVIGRMQNVAGRKAIILISTGVDTFSKAKLEDVLAACRGSATPIYVIGVAAILRRTGSVDMANGPGARIDWKLVGKELVEIAQASGGRAYFFESTLEFGPIYDDIMENLRLRYLITYKSSVQTGLDTPRTVRVALIDPKTGGPLQVVDTNGKVIQTRVLVQETYTPRLAAGGSK